MRKFLLLPVFFLTVLATSCSTDDSVQMNENNTDHSGFVLKELCMPLTGTDGLNASIYRTSVLRIIFQWNDNLTPDTGTGVTYESFVQIRNIGCDGSNPFYINYPIDVFNSSSYKMTSSTVLSNCFEWRMVVQKYLFNGQVLDCETATEWQQSNP